VSPLVIPTAARACTRFAISGGIPSRGFCHLAGDGCAAAPSYPCRRAYRWQKIDIFADHLLTLRRV